MLRRLLIQGYLVWPCILGVLLTLGLWSVGFRGEDLAGGVAVGVAGGVASGLTFGVVGGVVGSMASDVAVGVAFGLAFSVAGGVVGGVVFGAAFGVVGGIAYGVAGSVAGGVVRRSVHYTPFRQIGGGMVGLIISTLILVGMGYGIILVSDLLSNILSGITRQAILDLEPTAMENVAVDVAVGVAVGVAVCVAVGVVVGLRTRRWRYGVAVGVACGVAVGVAYGVAHGVAYGVFLGALFGAVFMLPYAITEYIAGAWVAAVTGALGGGALWIAMVASSLWPTAPLGLMGTVAGLSLAWWQPIALYPLAIAGHYLLLRLEESRDARRPALLRYHAAFWDEHQRLRWIGLDEHLVLVYERNPAEGQKALDYVANSRQRWAAQAAQIELDARRLERCAELRRWARSTRHWGLVS